MLLNTQSRAATQQGLGGGLPAANFAAVLQTTTTPDTYAGSGTPTFTRATTAYVLGYAAAAVVTDPPIMILCASGEARFTGSRRVSQGVWSTNDANGVALTTANGASATCCDSQGPFGYQAEGARADVLGTTTAIRRTMTDAGWVVGATMTVGSATGVDGVASAGASLTGGAVEATNTILFTTVLGSAARTFSAWVRRKTGTGTVRMTDNGGTNWTDITLTTTYTQFQVTRTQANPIVGFQIATNTDAIEVDFNTIEAASIANPTPIPVNVSKAADVLTYVGSGNVGVGPMTVYLEYRGVFNTGTAVNALLTTTDGAATGYDYMNWTTSGGRITVTTPNGTAFIAATLANNTMHKIARSSSGAGTTVFANGVPGSIASAATNNTTQPVAIQIGGRPDAAHAAFSTIRNVRIYAQALPDAQLVAMTG